MKWEGKKGKKEKMVWRQKLDNKYANNKKTKKSPSLSWFYLIWTHLFSTWEDRMSSWWADSVCCKWLVHSFVILTVCHYKILMKKIKSQCLLAGLFDFVYLSINVRSLKFRIYKIFDIALPILLCWSSSIGF